MITYNSQKDSYNYEKDKIDFFINVGFIVTRKCPLKCIHCCETPSLEDYGLDNIKKIINELIKYKLKKICITGGEPLMRKDIVEILKYIHSKDINITFSTNGILLTREIIEQIKPYINNIRFSIYGDQTIHDKTTEHKGSFEKLIECFKLTKSLDIPTSLIMTVMQSNLQDLNKVIKICEEYNITKLYLFTLMPTARGEKIYEKEYVAPEIIEVMIAGENEKDEKCVIKIINWNIEGQCVLIYENGDIVAQPSYKDVGNKKIVGNLFKESAKKIWEKYPFRQSHIDYYLDYH